MLTLMIAGLLLQAGPQSSAPVEMTTYQLVLLGKGTAAPPASPEAQKKMQDEHLARLADLNRKRVNLLYGPVLDPASPYAGIAVLDVKTSAEAVAAFADDPFVRAGVMSASAHPWAAPKNWFRQPPSYDVTKPETLEPLVFGILMRGPNTSQDKAAADEIQKGHLAYMESLHAQGKLPVAGPFADAGDMRGVVIYRVKDVAEAKALAAEDPAVKAGRLRLVAYPWMTLRGILQ
jgi:uncharacterized protein YciI